MSTSDDQRFHELAHKVFTNEATAAEQAELESMIQKTPRLREKSAELRAAGAAARELLEMQCDVEHPSPATPPAPVARLQRRVAQSFSQSEPSHLSLVDLLEQLQGWTGKLVGAERQRVMELIAAVRETIPALHRWRQTEALVDRMSEMATAELSAVQNDFAKLAFRRSALSEEEVNQRVEAEFQKRLAAARVQWEAEVRERLLRAKTKTLQSLQSSHDCNDELSALLELLSPTRPFKNRNRPPE